MVTTVEPNDRKGKPPQVLIRFQKSSGILEHILFRRPASSVEMKEIDYREIKCGL